MSLLKANGVQFGQSGTATNNLTLSVPSSPDGTIKLARGNSGATTADILSVDSSGRVGIGTTSPLKELQINATEPTIRLEESSASSKRLELSINSSAEAKIFANQSGGQLLLGTVGTERLRIDSSGNVGIGTNNPQSKLHLSSSVASIILQDNDTVGNGSNNLASYLIFRDSAGSQTGYVGFGGSSTFDVINETPSAMRFLTSGTERLRIDSSGNVLVGSASSDFSSGVGIKFNTSATAPKLGIVVNTASDNIYHLYNTNATNTGYRFYVNTNGGISNFSANNVNLSDERLKTNINLAGNYLEKICSIPVKTFNYKDQGEDTEKTIGVLAQEVEAVIPELINSDGFGETPADGIPLKTIYQTDLQYVLMRCIQEQQAMIQELSAKVTALENK